MINQLKFRQCHFFSYDGDEFLFNADLLRLYKVDALKDKIMTLYNKHGYENPFVPHGDDEIWDELIEADIVYDCQKASEPQKNKEHEKTDIKPQKHVLTNVVLQIANDCNLHCKYCYGDGGSYGRQRELMTFETAKKGIDYLLSHSGNLKEILITFFGGEPLLNFELIKEVIAYCSEQEKISGKKFRYCMTTNGTIVNDEILEYIKKYKISTMLSMDGGKEIQDCYRCYENGTGSFEIIKDNIEKFKEARGGYLSARATVCKPNMNLVEIRNDLLNLGFTNVIMSNVDTRKDSPLYIGKEEREEYIKNFKKLADVLIKEAKNGKGLKNIFISETLKSLYFKVIRIKSCSAGISGFAIGSDGNIYPCHRFMGMPDYVVGNVDKGIDFSFIELYSHANVNEKEACKTCWAKYICGGGCLHTCVAQGGSPMDVPECYCDTYRDMYEVVLYIYYVLKTWDENYFRNLLEKSVETSTTLK